MPITCSIVCSLLSYIGSRSLSSFMCRCYVNRRVIHSFPTRRSSDLHTNGCRHSCATDPADGHVLKAAVVGADWLQCRRCGAKDRKSTRLNSSHVSISYAVFCLKKKKILLPRDRVSGGKSQVT